MDEFRVFENIVRQAGTRIGSNRGSERITHSEDSLFMPFTCCKQGKIRCLWYAVYMREMSNVHKIFVLETSCTKWKEIIRRK
jgi:hypothetical protein